MAATLGQRGFGVLGVDIHAENECKLNAGEWPAEKPLLAEALHQGRRRFRATTYACEAVATQAWVFIVPSPSLPDGSFSKEIFLRTVQPVAQVVKAARKKDRIFNCSYTATSGACVLAPTSRKNQRAHSAVPPTAWLPRGGA